MPNKQILLETYKDRHNKMLDSFRLINAEFLKDLLNECFIWNKDGALEIEKLNQHLYNTNQVYGKSYAIKNFFIEDGEVKVNCIYKNYLLNGDSYLHTTFAVKDLTLEEIDIVYNLVKHITLEDLPF